MEKHNVTHKHSLKPAVILFAIALILAIITGTVYQSIMQIATDDHIYPNTYIAGLEVGGMTEAEAVAALEMLDEDQTDYTVTVILPDQQFSLTMGLEMQATDIEYAVQRAFQHGRMSTSPIDRLRGYMKAKTTRYDVKLVNTSEINTDAIWAAIHDANAAEVSEDESCVTIVENSIMITVGASSKSLNEEELFSLIYNAFLYQDTPVIDYDYTYDVANDIPLDELYDTMTAYPVNAYYDTVKDTVVEDVPGSVPEIPLETALQLLSHAEPGDTLLFPFSYMEADITVSDLDFPNTVEPEVSSKPEETVSPSEVPDSNASALLFQDVLATYSSDYNSSNANRSENIRLACEAMNGTVIEPGEIFSFNDTVGERTSEKGYRDAAVYVSGNTVNQLGGGICQAASTIYCCAMYADLDIVERSEHIYHVDYVPGGLDAAIYWGSLDLKFRNNTGYPIQVEASASDGRCTITLLGTDTEHVTVEIDSACISSTPYSTIYMDGPGDYISGYTGCTYQITRYVYDDSGNLIRTDTPSDLGSLGESSYSKRDEVIYTN